MGITPAEDAQAKGALKEPESREEVGRVPGWEKSGV